MLIYDKQEIKEKLNLDDVYELLVEWGGEPEFTASGLISKTICHNNPFIDSASRKLYYYSQNNLFYCYSGCAEPSFDIFQLVIKVFQIQHNQELNLNDAVRYIANKIGYGGYLQEFPEEEKLEDWDILANYERIQSIEIEKKRIVLKDYNEEILSRFNYKVKLRPWLDEGIAQFAIDNAMIGFYPGGD